MLLQLYCSLIYSKVDCLSFIYSSALKSKLSILDSIHIAGICLATGTFCHQLPCKHLCRSRRAPTVFLEGPASLQLTLPGL